MPPVMTVESGDSDSEISQTVHTPPPESEDHASPQNKPNNIDNISTATMADRMRCATTHTITTRILQEVNGCISELTRLHLGYPGYYMDKAKLERRLEDLQLQLRKVQADVVAKHATDSHQNKTGTTKEPTTAYDSLEHPIQGNWNSGLVLSSSRRPRSKFTLGDAFAGQPEQKTTRTLEEIYEAPLVTLSKEDQDRVLLSLLQRKDPKEAEAEAEVKRQDKIKPVAAVPNEGSFEIKDKTTSRAHVLHGGANSDRVLDEEQLTNKKWSTVKVKNASQNSNDGGFGSTRFVALEGDASSQFSSLDQGGVPRAVSGWSGMLSPKLATLEMVQQQMSGLGLTDSKEPPDNPPIFPSACKASNCWGCESCMQNASAKDQQHGEKPPCTCNGWQACASCVNPEYEPSCDGHWSERASYPDCTGVENGALDIPVHPRHNVATTPVKNTRQGPNRVSVGPPTLKEGAVNHDILVSAPKDVPRDSSFGPHTYEESYWGFDLQFANDYWNGGDAGDTWANASAYELPESVIVAQNGWNQAADDGPGGSCWSTFTPKPKIPTSTPYTVTYWATVESGDKSAHIPINSNNVFGPEKAIIEGDMGMRKVWKWVQEKGLGDKVGLQDAFDLAKNMHSEEEEDTAREDETHPTSTYRDRANSNRSPSWARADPSRMSEVGWCSGCGEHPADCLCN